MKTFYFTYPARSDLNNALASTTSEHQESEKDIQRKFPVQKLLLLPRRFVSETYSNDHFIYHCKVIALMCGHL